MPEQNPDQPVHTVALVVEGGGMRGVYSAGVLDSFLALGFDPFDLYLGVSAGAMNLLSFLSGQHERNWQVYQFCARRPEFISPLRFFRGGNWLDLDWMWDNTLAEFPLDTDRLFAHANSGPREFLVCCTDVASGKPVYVSPTPENLRTLLLASSAVPVFYRRPVELEGRRLVDGGVTDPIPVLEAYRRGARHIVVIRSRQFNYRKKKNWESRLGQWAFRQWPACREAVGRQYQAYNEAMEFINQPPEDCNVIQIAAKSAPASSRTTRSLDRLQKDYEQGLEDGEAVIRIAAAALQHKIARAMETLDGLKH